MPMLPHSRTKRAREQPEIAVGAHVQQGIPQRPHHNRAQTQEYNPSTLEGPHTSESALAVLSLLWHGLPDLSFPSHDAPRTYM